MKQLEIYDPPMCCATGVCGPTVDPALPKFAADLEWLKQQGIAVRRYNPAQEPQAFARNPLVSATLASDPDHSLPLLVWDGTIVSHGAYPSREQLAAWAGVTSGATPAPAAPKCACGPSGCC